MSFILDPSLPAGKRREIDNVMKKARANTNDYWDKKLLEVEEKDPNRWRHTGYKKMYIQGESSSGESDREGDILGVSGGIGGSAGYRYNSGGGPSSSSAGRYGRSRSPRSRSHSRLRKTPPLSPPARRRSPISSSSRDVINRPNRNHVSPPSSLEGQSRGGRPRSPQPRGGPPRSPSELGGRRPTTGGRPRSPPEPPMRRKASRSPIDRRRGSPAGISMGRRRSPSNVGAISSKQRGQILPRSKRPPSPPPRVS